MRLIEFINLINEDYELLFELRNIMNTDELKKWAYGTAQTIAQGASRNPDLYATVENWAMKILIKYFIKELPTEPLVVQQENPTLVGSPSKEAITMDGRVYLEISKLPPWAQNAIKQGEEIHVVQPWAGDAEREIRGQVPLVRDWIRWKVDTAPQEMSRLDRVPWKEAVRLAIAYHEELKVKRSRIATIADVLFWYRDNKEEILSQIPDSLASAHLTNMLNRAVKSAEAGITLNYAKLKDMIGNEGTVGLIRAFEKNNKPMKVELPEDDPAGRSPYLRYTPDSKPIDLDIDDFEEAPEIGPQWVKLNTRKCVEYEGVMMGNCVGSYSADVKSGNVWIFSFRDANNEPHITIEIDPSGPEVNQVKGKENEPPISKYHERVVEFLRKMKRTSQGLSFSPEARSDLGKMGMFASTDHIDKEETLTRISPPLDMEKWKAYEMTMSEREDDEEDDYPEEEATDENEGSLEDMMTWAGLYSDRDDTKEILDSIINGDSCYQTETETDWSKQGAQVRFRICYDGPGKDEVHEWERIV